MLRRARHSIPVMLDGHDLDLEANADKDFHSNFK